MSTADHLTHAHALAPADLATADADTLHAQLHAETATGGRRHRHRAAVAGDVATVTRRVRTGRRARVRS